MLGNRVPASSTRFCVVYRTGGSERFQWHRSEPGTKSETVKRLGTVRGQGYKAHLDNYDSSVAIGLPETYD
jgi:hypothetical protein